MLKKILKNGSLRKAVILILLFLLVILLADTQWGRDWDYASTRGIYDFWQNDGWRIFFVMLSVFGFGGVFGILAVFLFFVFKKRNGNALWYILFCGWLELLVLLIKSFFLRIRPYEYFPSMIAYSTTFLDKYSFPSAHSALAFFSAYFICHRFNLSNFNRFLLLSLAFLVALSRVYIGVHYLLDVIAGSLLGLLAGMLSEFLWSRVKQYSRRT